LEQVVGRLEEASKIKESSKREILECKNQIVKDLDGLKEVVQKLEAVQRMLEREECLAKKLHDTNRYLQKVVSNHNELQSERADKMEKCHTCYT